MGGRVEGGAPAGRADFGIPFDSFRPENALVVPGHDGNVSAVSHGLLRLMRGCRERCRERRNPNFSIELGDEVGRSTHSGGLRNVPFGCHCFCPLLNEEARGELR
jgi:hypothetical protein